MGLTIIEKFKLNQQKEKFKAKLRKSLCTASLEELEITKMELQKEINRRKNKRWAF